MLLAAPVSADTKSFAPGLDRLEFTHKQTEGLTLISIDPALYDLKILAAAQLKLKENMGAKQWCEKYHLTAAINAGMYQTDYRTAVGLLIADGQVNNRRTNHYKTILAFGATASMVPPMQIIDRQCQSFDELRGHYRSLLQGIRMISCQQKNTWEPGGEKWPIAAIGMTKTNRPLLVYARRPMTPHELGNTLLQLPLNLHNLMYLEGGPPAQFYLKAGKTEIDLTGSYSNAAQEAFPIRVAIPNVLGIVAKDK